MEQILEVSENVKKEKSKESITELINNVEYLIGAKEIKETLKFYNKFATMIKKNKIEIGNANIVFHCESRDDTYREILKVINTILVKHKIITGEYIEIDARSDFNKIEDKKLYVIDCEDENIRWDVDRIRRMSKRHSKSVFILVYSDKDEFPEEYSNKMQNAFYWNITVEQPTENEKKEYIKTQMMKNGYSYKENSLFIEALANRELYEIKQELMKAFIKASISRKRELEDKHFNLKAQKENIEQEEKQGLKKLEKLTGLEDVKQQIKKIINYVEVHKERKSMPMLHMCMTGNPGTGKTTVARIIGEIFSDLGILSDENKFVEASRDTLVAGYVGQTALKTKGEIEKAKGGVLFIDEAYSLTMGKDERKNDFGYECIATLIKEMENSKDNLCVILAGYKDEMKNLIHANSGFKSRIQFFIDFPDYTQDEMLEMFKNTVENEMFILEEGCQKVLLEYFKNEIEYKDEQFGNGRLVRNLFEKVKFEQAMRIKRENDTNLDLIKQQDIINVVEDIKTVPIKKVIGFAC